MSTKEKIMDEALNLFSSKGYDAVSVREIAKAVGIKESSLYNHFKNKQDIFDRIIENYSKRGDQFFYQLQITDADKNFTVDERIVNFYKNMTIDKFRELSLIIFEFYFRDDINVQLRKMLTIEQYRSPEISQLFRNLSFNSSLDYQTRLFEGMIKAGIFIEADPAILALEFFAPIFLVFYKYDNNEEHWEEAKNLMIRHVEHFHKTYTKKVE
ncbi:MAG: TetR/AcrR family transcriptional regulator [Firmicutes bacterium]|nr:TetR/AcrR family transcriptional regulator [Bacillota bacterium]